MLVTDVVDWYFDHCVHNFVIIDPWSHWAWPHQWWHILAEKVTWKNVSRLPFIVDVSFCTMSYKRNGASNLCSINALLYLTTLRCSLTRHIPPSRTVIIHQWHAVCFPPFLSACPRLMIQISGVHPDLYRTRPLIQPFSSCHHLVNWPHPDVSSWRTAQTWLVVVVYLGFGGCLLDGER